MKTSYVAAAAVLLAMLAAPAFAQNAATPAPAAGAAAGSVEVTGMKELGIDISKAGTTSQDVQAFVKALPADRQAKLKEACTAQLQQPTASQRPLISAFCKNMQGM